MSYKAIIELNTKDKVTGRTYIKWVVHEIHPDTSQYNLNGITWKEQYVLNNIDSVRGMPICVEFLDYDKSEPFGHGMTDVTDKEVKFENSQVVGVTENGWIDTIEVNGRTIKALIAEGYIYDQRYPNFVSWLKAKMYDDDFPETSVEICGKTSDGHPKIVYESGDIPKGRVPMIYDYTGDAILGIKPSDDSAVLLELNHYVNKKEKEKMDEETQQKIAELNQKLEDAKATIQTLTKYKEDAENKNLVAELNSKLKSYSQEEQDAAKEKITEFNSKPTQEGVQSILNEINSFIANKIIESRNSKTDVEVNSHSNIYSDMYEVNKKDDTDYSDIY
ncbi:hypothetical protein [Paenibacillus sp. O199]|uniref:hypothetical protein n=1 Tax=Paenibacillus sp. O199 TaxID=1643925 RepID=UPI0007BEF066|nr:hypothetical protein [Paenibacillus sp. O199]